MIQSIQIKNFKSVVDLKVDIGTFNVIVGENGCGKSNILEAIAFGAAASADKLDFEFLGSRGLRVTNPEFMFSAFGNGKKNSIDITFIADKKKYPYQIANFETNIKKWYVKNISEQKEKVIKTVRHLEKLKFDTKGLIVDVFERNKIGTKEEAESFYELLTDNGKEIVDIKRRIRIFADDDNISNYIIYQPEQSFLRKFEETNQIYPLGIKGEGLFQYLKDLSLDKKSAIILNEIKETLNLLDWYDSFDLADNLMSNEYALKIKDKYLDEKLQYFDQRSTNEGFLFLLFYATLFISKDTPTFFAIDNIDASFNPKLCVKLVKTFAELAKKHKKQVIVTTHNPAILDGLNLKDDNQRLFVVSRSSEGHTRAKRVQYNDKRTMNLGEIWTKGFIGGLPDNF